MGPRGFSHCALPRVIGLAPGFDHRAGRNDEPARWTVLKCWCEVFDAPTLGADTRQQQRGGWHPIAGGAYHGGGGRANDGANRGNAALACALGAPGGDPICDALPDLPSTCELLFLELGRAGV